MKKWIILSLVLSIWTGVAVAERDFDATVVTTTHVAGSVYIVQGEGGNIAVSAGEDGMLMVDDQFAKLQAKIEAAIGELSPDPVRFVLNTHWHGDHTGGNEWLADAGATIIAHDHVRERLSTRQVREMVGREDEAKPETAWPVITFDHSVTLHFNDETIDVVHFPEGHTDGDSVVFFRDANVVHMGDHFFNGAFPYIDLDSGGSVRGYLRNVERILNDINEHTKIIPGHGELGTKADLQRFHDMLTDAVGRVQQAIDAGQSLEEVQAGALTEEMVEQWATGFMSRDRWLEILYTDLKKEE